MMQALLIGNESLALQCGEAWLARGHGIAAVVTRHADVVAWAGEKGLRIEAPGAGLAERLGNLSCGWLLSIANLDLLPQTVLAHATRGAVNFHDGPLPRHAGLNAPVWAILEGDAQHGITWHLIEGGIDEGRIVVQRLFDIAPDETAFTLNAKCYAAALDSFDEVIGALEHGVPGLVAQQSVPRSYHARDDRPGSAWLDVTRPAADLARVVRALDHGGYFNPLCMARLRIGDHILLVGQAAPVQGQGIPGTVLENDGTRLTVATDDGALRLSRITGSDGATVDLAACAPVGHLVTPASDEDRQALADLATQDGYWRRVMTAMRPITLPVVSGKSAATERRALDLAPETALAAIATWAARIGGDEGAHLAYAGPVQADAPDLACPWVPVDASRLAEDMAEADARGPFALDLFAREPALDAAHRPHLGLRLAGKDLIPGTALTVDLTDTPALLFDSARVSPAMADLLAKRLEALGRGESAAMPEAERRLVVEAWNRSDTAYDARPIHRLIEAQAHKSPESRALVFESETLSHAALETRANCLAHVLRQMGVGPGVLVGLCLPRSADMVVAALAIWKAGGAYVPMDPAYPADRLAHYLSDSGARVVVTRSDVAEALPQGDARRLLLDTDPRLATAPDTGLDGGAGPNDLAYVIYTSGSTGRPKGVMVTHRNVANFFAGMDDRILTEPDAVWLAVTSLNFDISVLELFYSLARGYTLVLSGDEARALVSSGQIATSERGMEFSLYYWGNDDGTGRDKYKSLLEGAQFADTHGFCAVWTPERHFHAFGGPYPNPSVTGAAVAAVTQNLAVRAGSCVAPLHHTARIAEEWAVIDNLTNGRAGMAIASGWQPDDFILRPENAPPNNKPAMFDAIRDLRKLWRGEAVGFPRADGTLHEVVTQPRPVSSDLPVWVTTAGNPETWREAGAHGANVLTHLLGQSVQEVGDKIALYHAALREAGHDPADFTVTLMLHTYVAETREEAARVAREPMKDYLRSAAGLIKQYAWAFPAFKKPKGVDNAFQLDLGSLDEEELEGILDFAFERYFNDSGLFGTIEDCVARVEELKRIGVDEVACLIDYGIPVRQVLDGLRPLARVLERSNRVGGIPEDDFSIAAQILRHKVTHLQCTPSMARMIAMNDEARHALGRIRHLMLGGEALPGSLVQELRGLTQAQITNMYGPTETTIWSTTGPAEDAPGVCPIGTPISNTQTYVLDSDMQPVPIGQPGELWIGGDGVTRGYLGREDLTADRFRPDPFRDGGRIYGTGDLVRWRADGRLDFIGRADTQVKLRGYRIELGEIEAALETCDGVEQAVVLLREDTPDDPRLVAYLRGTASDTAIKAHLAQHLPAHMIPAHVVTLDTFPLTPNRKVDRKALPAPARISAPRPAKATAPVAPANSLEREIAAIWARILGVAEIGAQDSFFDLGGHSLLAVQAHREIRSELGVERLGITDIFRCPKLATLAARVAELRGDVPKPANDPEPAPATGNRATARAEAMAKRRAMRAARRG
ncbi:natural product biosynthesis luciferase-like monooxygenase domain-containing protein [Roseovarius tolerans]|uniref:Natural product biosynthesis luciferase-like monooxygenase domain-containing protein n=1 Tax=Roseovarius tolerans TaxID=74031 RepID=A0A1H8C824_9RHOB|nr:MupA/Atu3671 family FMN-dependent luciferase-like monooxygenase [Roseovarius tolerans]SEM91049.1 natural product biosynthesis luciferase-like monooxygenase domain-containing protein [Roseovarius tolerans]